MRNIKPIKTEKDYDEAVQILEELIAAEPEEGSEDSDFIMVLAALIEDYENATFPDYPVDPVEAIRFRMEQLELKNADLVPYLGSKSRVSEILSGKRSLTVKMIKNLEEGLGIPASALVGSTGMNTAKRWTPKIIGLMADRGYFGAEYSTKDIKEIISKDMIRFFLNSMPSIQNAALLRQTNYRDTKNVDKQLLNAWLIKVMRAAEEVIKDENIPHYAGNNLTKSGLGCLVALSVEHDGPLKAVDFLKAKGVVVVIEPHLPNTRLDGATIFTEEHAIIGLTLRHDRLDNFWFTLMHEIAHVMLHKDADNIFFDNLDFNSDLIDNKEKEADEFAKDAMIPADIWDRSPVRHHATPMIIKNFAEKNSVNEAIVAGRLRYESGQWHQYGNIVAETVRQFFKGKVW